MRTGRVRPARERGFFSRVRFSYACALGVGALHAGFVNGEAGGQFRNLLADALLDFGVADVGEDFGDPGGDLLHLRFAHAARGHRRAAEADAATLHGRQGIEGNGILVYGDASAVEGLFGITGTDAEKALDRAGITVNKNSIPFDPLPPMKGGGIRLGSPSVTTRGMRESEMEQIAAWITEILSNIGNAEVEQRVRKQVAELAARFPVYEARMEGAHAERARV